MAELALADVLAARRTIAGLAVRTPLVASQYLSQAAGTEVLLKLESTQKTGAFKLRGAANAIFNLAGDVKGVTCCSTGNHGRGVAFAARERGLKAIICMSSLVPAVKREGVRALGAEVRIVGDSQDEALEECLRLVAEEGLSEISPFDDPRVIAGQGTIGLELFEERPDLATILVPLSGGGLAGGIALAAKAIKASVRVVGITMERGAAMHASLKAGRPVEVQEVPSLADSLGGGIGLDNRLSFALCRDLLDEVLLVSEEEIYRAMQSHYFEDRLVCEGGSAVGAAAILSGKLGPSPGPIVSIVSGGNVDMATFTDVINGRDIRLGNITLRGRPYAA